MNRKINLAGIVDLHEIQYNVSTKTVISSPEQIKVYSGNTMLTITNITNMGENVDTAVIEVAENLDIAGSYRISIDGYGEKDVVPTDIFDTEYFISNFTYDGKLGALINGEEATFKLWAPTASQVVLNLFTSGHEGEAYKSVKMLRGDRGVWSHTEPCSHGTYYTYTVTTVVATQEAVDPYAKA